MKSVIKLVSSVAPKAKFSPSSSSFSSLSSSSSLLTQKSRLFSTDTKNNSHSHSHTHEHTHDHNHKSDQQQHHTQTDQKQKGHSKEKENPKENTKDNNPKENTTTKDNETNANKDKDNEQKLSPLEEAQARNIKLQNEFDALKDEYVRQVAEMDNTRRIARKDVADAKVFGIQSFAKSMFEVGDNLSLALDAVPKDQVDSNPALKSLFEGVQMTEKGFLKVLSEHGITRYSPLGEKFNPYHHQALFEVVDSTKETGVIANVLKDGYLLKDRVLRPASVGVFKGNIPQQKSQTPPQTPPPSS